jgi:hypothetical protein
MSDKNAKPAQGKKPPAPKTAAKKLAEPPKTKTAGAGGADAVKNEDVTTTVNNNDVISGNNNDVPSGGNGDVGS